MKQYNSLYAAFDVFPGAKGAAAHIHHMSSVLFGTYAQGMLVCLGNDELPVYQSEANTDIYRFRSTESNFLLRAEAYTQFLYELVQANPELRIAHFRDVWSGVAILEQLPTAATVFEVNALPSIELPYKYNLSESTLQKIEAMENYCLQKADAIIVPSLVTKNLLIDRGVPEEKIFHISNGAEIPEIMEKPADAPEKYLMYFGATQPWQGLSVLFHAFCGLRDFSNLQLLVASSHHTKSNKQWVKLTRKLNIEDRIVWKNQLRKDELQAYLQHAFLTVAPLENTPRNTLQGCSPLKIYESMACGVPVIASDLPVVHEILENKINGRTFTPANHFELSRIIRILLDFPENRDLLALNAREHIIRNHTWEHKNTQLLQFYAQLTTLHKT